MRRQGQNQYHQKEENAHQSVDAQFLHDDGPRKEEHRLDVEHQEEDGEEVVTHLELHPRTSARRDAALVGLALLGLYERGDTARAMPSATATSAMAVRMTTTNSVKYIDMLFYDF